MRQSPSLIRALRAAAESLTSDSQDLRELADNAAAISGIPAERILMNVDLTGIDLTGKSIDFLIDKGALYHAANLTAEQRAKFRKGASEGRSRQMRRKIRSIRVQIISDFIEAFEEQVVSLADAERKRLLDTPLLREILLAPIGTDYPADKPLDERYTQRVLVRLTPFAAKTNFDFFSELFRLLGDLKCEISQIAHELIFDDYAARFGDAVGDLIGQLPPNALLDARWIIGKRRDTQWLNIGKQKYDGPKIEPGVLSRRAKQINNFRLIHPNAVEEAMDCIEDALQRLDFIENARFGCNNDQAERIALRVVKGDWPASYTRRVLEAVLPLNIRAALFRQILHQGNIERTLEMLRWLNNNRGAVGALSLEDALISIDSFAALFDFASDVHMDLRVNQLNVLRGALNRTAASAAQRTKVRRLLPD